MFRQLTLLMFLLSVAYSSFANDVQTITERQRLESVLNELAYLQEYLKETKTSQKHNVRSRFDYQRINGDVDLIKHGISQYLNDIPGKPKGSSESFRAIEGNYTR